MNKQIQWVLNIVFAIGIGFILWNQNKTEEVKEEPKQEATQTKEEEPLEVRYVNSDSIWANYDYVKKVRKDLTQKQSEYRTDLEQRMAAFEKEVMAFQEEAPQMSRFEGEQKQKVLMEKEQELGRIQEDLSSKLMNMEDKMNRDIRTTILKYLKKYKEENVDLILDFSSNSSVLMVEDSLDITKRVLEGLNQEYQAKQKEK
jgi:outer membrane protein